jgi:hypothetical protein
MRATEDKMTVLVQEVVRLLALAGFSQEQSLFETAGLGYPPARIADPDGRIPVPGYVAVWKLLIARRTAGIILERACTTEADVVSRLLASGVMPLAFLMAWSQHAALVNPAFFVVVQRIDDEIEVRIHTAEGWAKKYPADAEVAGLFTLGRLLKVMDHLFPQVKPVLVRTSAKTILPPEGMNALAGHRILNTATGNAVRYNLVDLEKVSCAPDATHLLTKAEIQDTGYTLAAVRKGIVATETAIPADEQVIAGMVDIAKRALHRPDVSTQELSLLLGFKTHQHFVRAFRKETGLLPRVFRRMMVKAL